MFVPILATYLISIDTPVFLFKSSSIFDLIFSSVFSSFSPSFSRHFQGILAVWSRVLAANRAARAGRLL